MIEEPGALTTREVIERARAAAPAPPTTCEGRQAARPGKASGDEDQCCRASASAATRKRTSSAARPGFLIVRQPARRGGRAPRPGGYYIIEGKGDGKLPKRVSDGNCSVVQGQAPDPIAPAQGSAPLAAVALAPKPAVQPAPGPDLSVAYSAAVAKVTAGEVGGVGEIRKMADSGYAPAQFYLAVADPGRQGGAEEGRHRSRQWLEQAADWRRPAPGLRATSRSTCTKASAAPATPPRRPEVVRAALPSIELLDSQFNLAAVYEHGDGVQRRTRAEAGKWYLIAGRSRRRRGQGRRGAGASGPHA